VANFEESVHKIIANISFQYHTLTQNWLTCGKYLVWAGEQQS
jgi:hypothetical protein